MAKVDYQAPGLSVAEVLALVGHVMDWDVTDAASAASVRIFQAVTAAGQAASLWRKQKWWWLRATATFPTVAATASYTLRTVNINAMASLWSVEGVWYGDDWRITPIDWDHYRQNLLINADTGLPTRYVVMGEPPTIYLYPTPTAVETIYVDYLKRHSKITGDASGSSDAALIVPPEFHLPVYVDSAAWLLKHDTIDPMALEQFPAFVGAMQRMAEADPGTYDATDPTGMYADSRPGDWPSDRRVLVDGDSRMIQNTVTIAGVDP